MGDAIAGVRTAKGLQARATAAEAMARLVEGIPAGAFPAGRVQELIGLLEGPEDAVRFWVATALAHLGSRAGAAAPRLLELLPEAEKVDGAITAAGAIRHALVRMGVQPPTPSPHPRRAG